MWIIIVSPTEVIGPFDTQEDALAFTSTPEWTCVKFTVSHLMAPFAAEA